jgi:hypothetical protein
MAESPARLHGRAARVTRFRGRAASLAQRSVTDGRSRRSSMAADEQAGRNRTATFPVPPRRRSPAQHPDRLASTVGHHRVRRGPPS